MSCSTHLSLLTLFTHPFCTPPLLSHPPLPHFTADELIRQVTLDLPERGLLLLRIRDEARMTMDAYRTLYEGSTAFSMRKQLQAEEGVGDLEERVAELTEQRKALEAQVLATRNKVRRAGGVRACMCVCGVGG